MKTEEWTRERIPSRTPVVLTCFFIKQYFKLFNNVVVQCLFESGDRLFIGHLAVHKRASAALLHNLGTIISGYSAK